MGALRKTEIKEFLLDYLAPLLQDQDWLLRDDTGLVKIRDETLFGLDCYRSEYGPSFVFEVYIRPLYWPPAHYAYGIAKRVGSWCRPREGLGEGWVDLGSPELATRAANLLAPVINARVAPYLAQFPDGRAVLRYGMRHIFDPMLGWIRTGSSCGSDLFAYMSAWSGDRRKARARLRGAIADIRHDMVHIQRQNALGRGRRPLTLKEIQADREWRQGREQDIARLQQILRLLDRPDELHALLQETADQNRVALKLDRARPIPELMARRQRRRQQAEVPA